MRFDALARGFGRGFGGARLQQDVVRVLPEARFHAPAELAFLIPVETVDAGDDQDADADQT